MELGPFPSFLILLTALFMALLLSPVTGRCHGKWAIHACFGGNGKRSDPGMESDIPPNLVPLLRKRLEAEPSSASRLMAVLQSHFRSRPEVPSPSPQTASGYRLSPHLQSRLSSGAGLLHRLLFTDIARLIQEDQLSREQAAASPLEGDFDGETAEDQPFPVELSDLDAIRSFVVALKLEHVLRSQEARREQEVEESADDSLIRR